MLERLPPRLGRAATVGWLCVLLPGAFGARPVVAQEITRVEQLRLVPDAHVNELRTLVGVVERLVDRGSSNEPAFYLEDDFGHQILVIPFGATPTRGMRLRVTGVVTLDRAGDPVITAFNDAGIAAVVEDPSSVSGDPAIVATSEVEPEPTGSSRRLGQIAALVALAVVLAVATRALLVVGRRSRGASATVDSEAGSDDGEPVFPIADLWPPPGNHFEGRTLRFARPDSRIKLMPARLEVVRGEDAGEEIRFVGIDSEPISMMFGRAEAEGPFNVQLKQQTVSRTHAVVRFRHGEWLIENLSMTNPTILNGEVLGVKERLLTEGDVVEMGEVAFRFRES
jgi:hypothetical protein